MRRTYPIINRRGGGTVFRSEARSEDDGARLTAKPWVVARALRRGRATQPQAEKLSSLPTRDYRIGSSKPKKRLGQNFLVDKNILQKIADSAELKSSATVIEIGAGKGELTEILAAKAGILYAFEIDKDLCRILEAKFKDYPNVRIINQDILTADLNNIKTEDIGISMLNVLRESMKAVGFRKNKLGPPKNGGLIYKVLGNIPYYISSPIIEHLLNFKDKIECIFITVQKEFAKRIISIGGSKEYGSLSCFVQYYTLPRILFPISRTCFRPIPKVDSCFLKLQIRQTPAVKVKDEQLFFKIIRAAFNQRRKTLRNSLEGIIPGNNLEDFFKRYNLDRNVRPECLSLEAFANLTDTYEL